MRLTAVLIAPVRFAWFFVLVGCALSCFAQPAIAPPQPVPARSGCGDALVVTADVSDLTNAPGGHAGTVEWIHCHSLKLSYSLGLSVHSVADANWRLARGGATFRPRPELILYANVNSGSGDSAGRNFKYLTLTNGLIVKADEPLYLKIEHQFFDIGAVRGNLLRLAGIVTLMPAVIAEISVARSIDSNVSIRSSMVRIDWDAGAARPFAGAARGRQIPQAFEVVAGTDSPDFSTRQWFTGITVPFREYEWIVAFDNQRGQTSSRRTITSALRSRF